MQFFFFKDTTQTVNAPTRAEAAADKSGVLVYYDVQEALKIGSDCEVEQDFDLGRCPYLPEIMKDPSKEKAEEMVA